MHYIAIAVNDDGKIVASCPIGTEDAEALGITEPAEPTRFGALIPGQVTARYDDGVITSLTFMPWGSSAGYFGPSAEVIDGHADGIDLDDVDGPFWKAMQSYLAGEGAAEGMVGMIDWEE